MIPSCCSKTFPKRDISPIVKEGISPIFELERQIELHMISESFEIEKQGENDTKKGAHARFEPGTSKFLQKFSFLPAHPLDFDYRRESTAKEIISPIFELSTTKSNFTWCSFICKRV